MKKASVDMDKAVRFFSKKRISGKLLWSLFLLFTLLAACHQPEESDETIVKFYGNGNVCNFSQDYILYTTRCHVGQPGALMAAHGDILLLDEWLFVHEPSVKNRDGSVSFIESDSVLMLNGKTAGIKVDNHFILRQLVDMGDKNALRGLKILYISPEGLSRNRRDLAHIATLNPGPALILSGEFVPEDLRWLLQSFNPSVLSIDLYEEQQELLSSEQQLVSLLLNLRDSIYRCTPLPALANLRHLHISMDGNDISAPPENRNWLKKNPQIKSLMLNDWGNKYPKGLLSAITSPEVLVLGGTEVPAEEIMAHSKSLKRVLTDSVVWQLNLPHVQNIAVFDSEDPQKFIDEVVTQKSGCKALQIFADGKSLDVKALQSLTKLEALTLIDADSISISPLLTMKNLKLLSYSADSTNTDSTISVLQSALPNTLVVANDGLCVGSGWLLALAPVLLSVFLLAVYRQKQR